MRTGPNRRRGATLLVSIAILTLLSVFSLAFLQLVRFERAASANYVDGVRSRMLARAGMARAVAELGRIATRRAYSDPVADGWQFKYQPPGDLGGREPSLMTSVHPSFANVHPTLRFFGPNTPLVYTGLIGSSFGTQSGSADVYKLKVIDAASQLNLNHPDRPTMKRMLFAFLRACRDLDQNDPVPGKRWTMSDGDAQTLADRIVDDRPVGGFQSPSEMLASILSAPLGGTAADWERRWNHPSTEPSYTDDIPARPPLRDMVTVHSWVDPSVIRPWRIASSGTGLSAVRDLQLMPRAPVNLNTASEPVLTAILSDLRADGPMGVFGVDYATAAKLARAIVDHVDPKRAYAPALASMTAPTEPVVERHPFRNWDEFERWLDADTTVAWGGVQTPNGLRLGHYATASDDNVLTAVTTRHQGGRDLVKAMLNPNSMIGKFGLLANHGGSRQAGFMLPRLVDKSDITQMTTEGCFDSMGVFDVTSAGMVLVSNVREPTAPGLLVQSLQTEQEVIRVYDVFRLTSQADLERNRALMAQGDFIVGREKTWDFPCPPYSSLPGANKEAFNGYLGWPGVTSYPAYSLTRSSDRTFWSIDPNYTPAAWDGYLALSNLQAVKPYPWDFACGFNHGSLEAFKVRVWWEPKDQEPYPHLPLPATVGTGTKSPDLSNPKLTMLETPTCGGPLSDQTGGIGLRTLARPQSRSLPRLKGDLSQEANPLDAKLGGAADVSGEWSTPFGSPRPGLFTKGSALTNHGVIVDADRGPGYLCYDGNNIDLNHGTSIRFWVMPLTDPFAQEEEVLFSWKGSQGTVTPAGFDATKGENREIGFTVRKRVIDEKIVIELDPTTGNRKFCEGSAIDFQYDVTPGIDSDVGTRATAPEWLPGTWHWIVINFGPYATGANPAASDVQRVSLQVDRMTPIKSREMMNGEIHGYKQRFRFAGGKGGEDESRWLSQEIIGSDSSVHAGVQHKFLGDYYHAGILAPSSDEQHEDVVADALKWNNGQSQYQMVKQPPPFPNGSFDRQMLLRFRTPNNPPDPGTGTWADHDGTMEPNGTTGVTVTGWTYNFSTNDMGPDQVGGGKEYTIDLVARYKTSGAAGGGASCPYCGTHDHCYTEKKYWAREPAMGVANPPVCWVWWSGSMNHANVFTPGIAGIGLRDPAPPENVCDQDMGCEGNDVDGPMFFGGEPAGSKNSDADGVLPVDPTTQARAIFDNIIIKNNAERRTDQGSSVEAEDRFYHTLLAAEYSNDNDANFGALYRRALLELSGLKVRLGSMTWTSYQSSDGKLEFDISLRRLPGGDGTNPTFRLSNDLIGSDSQGAAIGDRVLKDEPAPGAPAPPADAPRVGYTFASQPVFDGTSIGSPADKPYPKDLLLLVAQLKNMNGNHDGITLPKPITESPVLEDVTLTFVRQKAQILYAEEGVEE